MRIFALALAVFGLAALAVAADDSAANKKKKKKIAATVAITLVNDADLGFTDSIEGTVTSKPACSLRNVDLYQEAGATDTLVDTEPTNAEDQPASFAFSLAGGAPSGSQYYVVASKTAFKSTVCKQAVSSVVSFP